MTTAQYAPPRPKPKPKARIKDPAQDADSALSRPPYHTPPSRPVLIETLNARAVQPQPDSFPVIHTVSAVCFRQANLHCLLSTLQNSTVAQRLGTVGIYLRNAEGERGKAVSFVFLEG